MFWLIILGLISVFLNGVVINFFVQKLRSFSKGSATPELNWIDFDSLPKKAAKLCESKSGTFHRAGFSRLGILKVKHRMLTMYDCYFENGDKSFVAEISCYYMFGFFVSSSMAIRSLLEHGTIVETSSHEKLPPEVAGMANEKQFSIMCAGTENAADLLTTHKRNLVESVGSNDVRCIDLDQDMIAELTVYGLNLADQFLHKQGVIAEKPSRLFQADDSESLSEPIEA